MVVKTPIALAKRQFWCDYHNQIKQLGFNLGVCVSSSKGEGYDTIEAIIYAEALPVLQGMKEKVEGIIPKMYSHQTLTNVPVNLTYQTHGGFQ